MGGVGRPAPSEKVFAALDSKSFNRDELLRSLDRFYRTIEEAAKTAVSNRNRNRGSEK